MAIEVFKPKILGINGSPNKKGNTHKLVDYCLQETEVKGAQILDLIDLTDLNVSYCRGCHVCNGTRCAIEDDFPRIIEPKLLEADGIILGTPVYIASMSGLLKTMIDRTYKLRHKDMALANKVVGPLVTFNRIFNGAEHTLYEIIGAMMTHGIIPATGMEVSKYGALGWCNENGSINGDEYGFLSAKALAARMVELCNIVHAGLEQYPQYRVSHQHDNLIGKRR